MSPQRLNVAFFLTFFALRMPFKNLQADRARNVCRFCRKFVRIKEDEEVVSHGKRRSILACKSIYIMTAFQEVSLWKFNFFIQTAMINCKQTSQDVSMARILHRSNGWRVPWRLSGGHYGQSQQPTNCTSGGDREGWQNLCWVHASLGYSILFQDGSIHISNDIGFGCSNETWY